MSGGNVQSKKNQNRIVSSIHVEQEKPIRYDQHENFALNYGLNSQ